MTGSAVPVTALCSMKGRHMRTSLSHRLARFRLAVSLTLPDKPVRRRVRGIDMLLPRRHGLPYFAGAGSLYAENLVELSRLIREAEGELCLLDIGANVGDSVLLALDRAQGSAVCVEPDPEWLTYLEANVGDKANIAVEPSILLGAEADLGTPLAIVHHAVGTSQVTRADEGGGIPAITTDELLRRHPQLERVRLIKSDTDGYDVLLMPHLVKTFAGSRPVIFFEYDPRPTRIATPELDPKAIWQEIAAAGYEQAVIWDNRGRLITSAPTSSLAALCAVLDQPEKERGYGFWDVAVAHREDRVGLEVLAAVGSAGTAA